MARPKEAVTEAKLARIMASLYPVRGWRRKTPPFRFGFVTIPGTPLGCCLDADPPIAHDPLFYFILYFLERTAVEKGYFGMRAEPASRAGRWWGSRRRFVMKGFD